MKPTEKTLATGLKALGMKADEAIGILLFLKTEEKMNKLIDWMLDHPKTNDQEVMEIALKILKNQM